jgi:hypothetical protein
MPLGGCLTPIILLVGIIVAVFLWWRQDSVSVFVPARELNAYHYIQHDDLVPLKFSSREVPTDALRVPNQIVGRYTLVSLPASSLIQSKQLHAVPDSKLIEGRVIVAMVATPAMILGGSLKAGDVVDIIVPVPSSQQASSHMGITASQQVNITADPLCTPPPKRRSQVQNTIRDAHPEKASSPAPVPRPFSQILVLDVKTMTDKAQDKEDSKMNEGSSNQTCVIVVALPKDRSQDFADASAGGNLLIVRSH